MVKLTEAVVTKLVLDQRDAKVVDFKTDWKGAGSKLRVICNKDNTLWRVRINSSTECLRDCPACFDALLASYGHDIPDEPVQWKRCTGVYGGAPKEALQQFANKVEVSTKGEVRVCAGVTGVSIEPFANAEYDRFYLKLNNPKVSISVSMHCLVMGTFLGAAPTDEDGKRMVVDHKDRDKGNNNISNLAYVPLSVNSKNVDRLRFETEDKDDNYSAIVRPLRPVAFTPDRFHNDLPNGGSLFYDSADAAGDAKVFHSKTKMRVLAKRSVKGLVGPNSSVKKNVYVIIGGKRIDGVLTYRSTWTNLPNEIWKRVGLSELLAIIKLTGEKAIDPKTVKKLLSENVSFSNIGRGRQEVAGGGIFVSFGNMEPDAAGYTEVKFQLELKTGEKQRISTKLHRIVCYLFNERKGNAMGVPFADLDVDHDDDDPKNNNASNLVWMTRKDHLEKTNRSYGRRYNAFAAELKSEFGDKITVAGEATPTATSKFEVTVDGKLVHSKIGGQGFVDSDKKLQAIFDAIEEALKA